MRIEHERIMANDDQRRSFAKGETIFKEGDQAAQAYLVEKGAVEIAKVIEGERRVLGTVDQGGIFGELALIDNQPRMATAGAASPTTLLVISKEDFNEKLKQADPFIRALLRIFVQNIRTSATSKTADAAAAGMAVEPKSPPGEDLGWMFDDLETVS